uniref:Sucrose-phosphatase n=1 Tax=Tetradesmus obliquus TaxID=3088 RepID=A0A383VZ45_TETOB|eukprot:jgi/Sobl393_1/14999/SZX70728.1
MATIQDALHACPKPRFMLVSDLDHTMVQNEDLTHEKLQLFNRLWSINFSGDSLLVFSTGRSPNLFCQLWDEAPLLTPNVLICSVGSEIFYRTPDGSLLPDKAWEAYLDQGWDRAAVQKLAAKYPQLAPQVASEQRRHKLSFHLQRSTPEADEAVLQGLREGLAAAGLAAKVIYSGGVDVDVLAQGAGKGKALEFILKQLQEAGAYPPDGVQVNGDSGNDIELFQVPGVRGCVVSNAHPELRSWATAALDASTGGSATPATLHLAQQPCAGGIVEALLLFGSVQNPPQPQSLLRGFVTELGLLQSNALAGNLALLAEPGATWVTPAGRVLQVVQCMGEPADAAAAGLTWVDRICVRPLVQKGGQTQQQGAAAADAPAGSANNSSGAGSISEGELLVVTYQLWSFKGQSRDSSRVRQCSVVVRAAQPAAADGFKLLHLHEGVMAADATATAAFAALAATST